MPGKMARSDPRPPFELLEVKVAVRTSRCFAGRLERREYSRQFRSHLENPGLTLARRPDFVPFPSSGWGFASGRPQSMVRNRKTMAANSKTALPATDKPSKPLRGRCAAGRALSKLVDVTTLRADID